MLSEKSAVSIGLLIAILGGAGFVTKTYFMAESSAQAISELKYDLRDEIKALRIEIKELRLEIKRQHDH